MLGLFSFFGKGAIMLEISGVKCRGYWLYAGFTLFVRIICWNLRGY